MNFFIISSNEVNRFTGIPHSYQLMYIYLRSKMDQKSRMIGDKEGRKISLQAIREWLYVEPGPGIKHSGSPSVKQIRVALQALKRAGLIESRSIVSKDHKQLILFLPYAVSGYSVQNKEGTDGAHQVGIQCDTGISARKSVSARATANTHLQPGTQEGTLQTAEVGTPHSNKYKNTLYSKSPVLDSYQPSNKIITKFEDLDLMLLHTPLELQKFIAYYKSQNTQSADWDSQYLCWLINAKQYQQRGVKRHGNNHRTPARQKLSAVDQVRQANQSLLTDKAVDVEPDNQGRYLSLMD